jgi:hypothetical protein
MLTWGCAGRDFHVLEAQQVSCPLPFLNVSWSDGLSTDASRGALTGHVVYRMGMILQRAGESFAPRKTKA